jgi:hypothetical protein
VVLSSIGRPMSPSSMSRFTVGQVLPKRGW